MVFQHHHLGSAPSQSQSGNRIKVHVEIALATPPFSEEAKTCSFSPSDDDDLRRAVDSLLRKCCMFRHGPVDLSSLEPELSSRISSMTITEPEGMEVPFWNSNVQLHFYPLFEAISEIHVLEGDGGAEVPAYTSLLIPSTDLDGLWDSIIVEDQKSSLLSYATSSIHFADRGVDTNLVSFSRIVLLHGPPGTGKTSLCKALAQKLAIRMSDRFSRGQFLEIHAHSLFSKFFSESGKIVTKVLTHIHDEVSSQPDTLFVILFDEIESLTQSRQHAIKGNEPSDAVRVVNAMLVSLDRLRSQPNLLILCTSNLPDEAIDPALLDRIDLRLYLGTPSLAARYAILRSSVLELLSKNVITPPSHHHYQYQGSLSLLPLKDLTDPARCPCCHTSTTSSSSTTTTSTKCASCLVNLVARVTRGMSGRELRKLPLLAHSLVVDDHHHISLHLFLSSLHQAALSCQRAKGKEVIEILDDGQSPPPTTTTTTAIDNTFAKCHEGD